MDTCIYYQNVRGLRTKSHNFYCNTKNYEYKIIALTETFLCDGIQSSEYFDHNYVTYRRDRVSRNTPGGGVLLAVHDSIVSCEQLNWRSSAEDLWVSVKISGKESMCHLCCVYLPPRDDDALIAFVNNTVEICNSHPNDIILIFGDFNVPDAVWTRQPPNINLKPSGDSLRITNITEMASFGGLLQFSDMCNDGYNVLDLVYCNQYHAVLGIERCDDSLTPEDIYHPSFIIKVNVINTNYIKKGTIRSYNFNKGNYDKINDDLLNYDWKTVFAPLNTNASIDIFYNVLNNLILLYIPKKRNIQ